MNDYKGLLLFTHVILAGSSGYKRLPVFLKDEIDMLADRWGCNTIEELRLKIKSELDNA